MPITVDFSNPPLINDSPADFNSKGVSFAGKFKPFVDQANALQVAVNQSEIQATAAANAAALVAGAGKWASGVAYGEGVTVWSPLDFRTYRRKTAGAGTLDPALDWDRVSWVPLPDLPIEHRNRITNGNAAVSQMGANYSVNVPPSVRVTLADMWSVQLTGTEAGVASCTNSLADPQVSRTGMVVDVPSGVVLVDFVQRIEARLLRGLAGKQVTFSWWIEHSSTNPTTSSVYARIPTAYDDHTTQTDGFYTAVTAVPAGAMTRVTATVTLPLTTANGLEVWYRLASPAGITGRFIRFTDAQMHDGAVALPFSARPYALELMSCMSQLQVMTSPASGTTAFCAGQVHTATQVNFAMRFPVPMRAPPAITHNGVEKFAVQSGGSSIAPSSLAFQGITEQGGIPYTAIAGGTVGRAALLVNSAPGALIILSARL